MVSQRARKDTKERQKVEEPKITQLELPKTTEKRTKWWMMTMKVSILSKLNQKKLVAKLVIIH